MPLARKRLAPLAVLGVVASGLLAVAAPAQAADPVSLTLLNINDFHGRIDANTTKFATTIEQIRADKGEANTLFLSAGDNIGASLFASATAEDVPTLDVLNALDLAGSAVGNHEFDRGFADLTGRVQDAADFDYLGANVYQAGTTTPALQEYATYEVAGLTVGVIGAVTEETPSLVSPAGVATLTFGDPVAAVNRVAAQLSDGQVANGEADVIVAEYHEGAGFGAPEGSTLEEEVADGGAFADIVTKTSAAVDVIFTGHTHKQYAWDAPIPGEEGTRPVLQTGSYGAHVGQVDLTLVDGEVTAYAATNVARAAAEDLSLPRVAEVKAITDAALAHAAEVGNRPVAQVTADITTAFSGGSYVDGRYTGGTRDDRASESTLGDLVANALRDGLAKIGDPDLGVTNPGGLRAELLYAGDTSSNPANTDGVVTFAEANAVLPFNNTVALVDLTGAQLKTVLEQQWQTNADGTVPSRAYLQLGLSDNVRVTVDPSAEAGSRVTGVWIDDRPLDAAATYTVSTLSFLATGGDNFRAFKEGRMVDTGLLDAELWRDYLAANAPLSPDFARQQVVATGLPASVSAGEQVTFTLSRLDLTSLGSPANTTVRVHLVQGGRQVPVGDFPVTDGTATVSFTAPADLVGDYQIGAVAEPSGTVIGAVKATKADSRVVVRHTPKRIVAGKTRVVLQVSVKAPGEPTGEIRVRAGGRAYTASLGDGRATVRLRPFPKAGEKTVTVRYLGDALTARAVERHTLMVRR